MNYKDFNDYELLDYIASCNEEASEILLYKYRPLLISLANKFYPYCLGGVDQNDLIQEGMIALHEAIRNYDENNKANFGTYAKVCIERRMLSLVKKTRTYKNKVLNESITFEIEDEDKSSNKLLMDSSLDPSNLLEEFETQQELVDMLEKQLTDFEKQVFELKKNAFTYKEIAEILEKEPKAIDNTLQRIKQKLKKIMDEKK